MKVTFCKSSAIIFWLLTIVNLKPKMPQKKKLIALLTLFLCFLVLLIVLLAQFKKKDISELIPADTIFISKLDINNENIQTHEYKKFFGEISKDFFQIEIPEGSTEIGYFLLINDEIAMDIYFIRNEQAILQNYSNQIKIDDFIFFSDRKDAIELLKMQNFKKLAQESSYKKTKAQVPKSNLIEAYINWQKVDNATLKNLSFFADLGVNSDYLKPFLANVEAEYFAGFMLNDEFWMQSFLSFNSEIENDKTRNIMPKLIEFSNEKSDFTINFESLKGAYDMYLKVIASNNSEILPVLDVLSEEQIALLFGSDVRRDDLFEVFDSELMFESFKNNKFRIIAEISDEEKTKKMLEKFVGQRGKLRTQIVTHTLEDGSVMREIITVPQEIKKQVKELNGNEMHILSYSNTDRFFYYFDGDFLIFGNEETAAEMKKNSKVSIDKFSNQGEDFMIFEQTLFDLSEFYNLAFNDGAKYLSTRILKKDGLISLNVLL